MRYWYSFGKTRVKEWYCTTSMRVQTFCSVTNCTIQILAFCCMRKQWNRKRSEVYKVSAKMLAPSNVRLKAYHRPYYDRTKACIWARLRWMSVGTSRAFIRRHICGSIPCSEVRSSMRMWLLWPTTHTVGVLCSRIQIAVASRCCLGKLVFVLQMWCSHPTLLQCL